MESSKACQQKKGSLIPLSLSRTLWSSENPTKDSRPNDGTSSKSEKDKGSNVKVVLRCRPLTEDEKRANTPITISWNEQNGALSVIQNIVNKQISRTFLYDKVFGPSSQQKDLYEQAISPLVNEALEGYDCTIFAYGQTGTGKTYTMEGEGRKNGTLHNDAGVIPRAVQQIFYVLETENAEYSMKVTFLELYNEEISDLLAPGESLKSLDDKPRRPITLMEDSKGAVFVRGLEERTVCTAEEIYKILEDGSARKRVAEILLNKQSNRSHSIFSIAIHIKECTPEGVELIRCGKLNLVDLAGSENIMRSGATEGRAREAGEINKSLLTIGRVINALVEHSGHVPYRDSKLTRLLRDSLGGRTKTCVIATISPSIYCLEETLSTLDYAYRAKNIKNRPQANQKVIKSVLIKDLYSEIDRLKQELHPKREKNGIYVPRDNNLNEEAPKKEMVENIERLKLDSETKKKQLIEAQERYFYQQQLAAELSEKLERTQMEFELTEQAFHELEEKYRHANETIKEKEYLIFNLLGSEKTLTERALKLQTELENAASEAAGELKAQLQKLKVIYGSGIKYLDEMATKCDGNLQLALSSLSSEITRGSASLLDLFRNIASEADAIIGDIETNLTNQEEKIATLAQQQHEAHSRSLGTTQSISAIIVKSFKTLSTYLSEMALLMDKGKTNTDQELCALGKELEVNTVNEEKQLMDKMVKLLASSNARKRKMVQTALDDLQMSAASRTSKLYQEMSNIQDLASSVQEEWTNYMRKTDMQYLEDTSAVGNVKDGLEESLKHCMAKAKMVSEQWMDAQESALSLQRRNVESVETIFQARAEANQRTRSQFSSVALSTIHEAEVANESFLSLMEDLLAVDHNTSEKIDSMISPCYENMRELEKAHFHQTLQITENAEKCLINECKVVEPSYSAPRKKTFDSPSTVSIEETQTPAFGQLLSRFRELNQQNK